jgi:myo-inositol 2-dehydrogenase / D-chiro-inositol 1-dehydrogenase
MTVARLRAGLIGAGWIAERHLEVLDATAEVELVAVCDTEPGRARRAAAPRGARAYDSWEEMLDSEPLDVLWVCTPPLAHRGPAATALQRGIHVYLEKPIARTLEDGLAIVAAADGAPAICAIAYMWHALDLLEPLREQIAEQPIGMLVGRNFGPTTARPWFLRRSEGGGQIFERASHHIDLQRTIAGEVAEVRAVAGTVALTEALGSAEAGDAIEPVGSLLLRFESGALGAIHTAWTRPGAAQSYALELVTSDALMTLELGPERFSLRGRAADRLVELACPDPFAASISRFLEAVRTGEPERVACTPADALGTLRVALACERALACGGAVAVER